MIADNGSAVSYSTSPSQTTTESHEMQDVVGNFVSIPTILADSSLQCIKFTDVRGEVFSIPERFFSGDMKSLIASLLSRLRLEVENSPEDYTELQYFYNSTKV